MIPDLSRLKLRLAAVLAGAAGVLAAVSVLYYSHHRASLRADAEQLLLSTGQIKLDQLLKWRKERLSDALLLAESPVFSSYANRLASGQDGRQAAALARERLRSFIKYKRYPFAALTDSDGRVLAYAGEKPEVMCRQFKGLVPAALAARRPMMGDFYLSEEDASPHIDIVTPVGGGSRLLLLRVSPADYLYPLLQSWSAKRNTGEILLVGRDGKDVLFLNDLRHIRDAAMRLRLPADDPDLPAAMGLRGDRRVAVGRDYRGVKVLAAVNPVEGTNWALVTKLDWREVMAGSVPVAVMLALLSLALLALIGAGTYTLLRVQEEKAARMLARLTEQVPGVVYQYRLYPDGRSCFPYSSSGMEQIYEVTPEEVREDASPVFGRIHPDDLKGTSEAIFESARSLSVFHWEFRVVLPKQGLRWRLCDARPERLPDGGTLWYGIITDITERKRAEEQLGRLNERLTLAARAGRLGVWDWDIAANELGWDDRMYELYGVRKEDFSGAYEAWLKGLHPGDRPRCEQETKQALLGERPYETEFRVVWPDGSVHHLKASGDVFRDAEGKPVRMVGVNQDVTERKLGEKKLQESEERLRVTLEQTQIGTWDWDVERDVWQASPTYFTMLGYEPEEGPADRKVWLERVHPDDRAHVAEKIGAVLSGSKNKYQYEARMRHADGDYRWHVVMGTSVKSAPDGKPLRLMGVRMDVTERRSVEEINSARVRLLQYAAAHTLDELLEETLNEAEKITGSQIAFYHFVNEDQKSLTLQNWSTATKARFCKAEGKGLHYDISEAGVWVDCFHQRRPVIHNDYASLPHKKGMPAGHAAVTRELAVPVLRGGKVTAILGVGNKPVDYTGADAHAVSLLADLAWEVAQRKKAEEALRVTASDLKEAQRLARIGNWTLELPSNRLSWSGEIYRIFEMDPEKFGASYEAFLEAIHPDDREFVNKAYTDSLRDRTSYDIVHRLLMKDGRVKYVNECCETVYSPDGSPLRSAGTVQDITERKLAENALRESEKAVRRKLDAILSPDMDVSRLELSDILDAGKVQRLMDRFYALTRIGIGIIDLKGKVLVGTGWQEICTKFHRATPETCKLCVESDLELSRGVPAGETKLYQCRNHMWDMVTPIMLGDVHVGNIFLGQFLFEGEEPDLETFKAQARRYGFDEEKYLAALKAVPRWSRSTVDAAMSFYAAFAEVFGQLSFSNVKLANTLEARNRAQAELQKAARALREKNQEMENFLYITTHDLRSPLVNIQGFSQNLKQYFEDIHTPLKYASPAGEEGESARKVLESKIPEALGFILESSGKMDRLLSALLKVSRLGRQELKPERLDVGAMLSGIQDAMRFQLQEAGAEIKVSALPPCRADALSVNQLFSNLIDNAVKYRSPEKALRVEITGETAVGKAVYRVSDNGPGIPEADLARIWDVFCKPAQPGQSRGEGIGLPMCRRIAERNGGAIRAESKPGEGTVFTVELPAAEEAI